MVHMTNEDILFLAGAATKVIGFSPPTHPVTWNVFTALEESDIFLFKKKKKKTQFIDYSNLSVSSISQSSLGKCLHVTHWETKTKKGLKM